MNRSRLLITVLAALALTVAGCQLGEVTTDAEADADAIAAAIAGPSDGMTQEAMDIGGYLFGASGGSASMMNQASYVFPAGALGSSAAISPASCGTMRRRPTCGPGRTST